MTALLSHLFLVIVVARPTIAEFGVAARDRDLDLPLASTALSPLPGGEG